MDNRIVNYPALKQLVAKAASVDTEQASEFLHALFDIISQSLAHGESVKIKGIGTFRRAEDSNGVPTVAYIPDVDLADAINSPFAFFEAVELSPSVSADDLAGIGQPQAAAAPLTELTSGESGMTQQEDIATEGATPEPEPDEQEEGQQPDAAQPPAVENSESPEPDPSSVSDNQPVVMEDDTQGTEITDCDCCSESVNESEEHTDSGFEWPWLLVPLIIGLLLGFGAGYLCHDDLEARLLATETADLSTPATETPATDTIQADTAAAVGTPAPVTQVAPVEIEEVYDTIYPTRFLTTMARRHYGQMDYWVYIYMENADRLGHPDRARPGTVVRIPPISKYVAPDDTTALKKARNLAAEIYGKYK